jgi:hypothetical protein
MHQSSEFFKVKTVPVEQVFLRVREVCCVNHYTNSLRTHSSSYTFDAIIRASLNKPMKMCVMLALLPVLSCVNRKSGQIQKQTHELTRVL